MARALLFANSNPHTAHEVPLLACEYLRNLQHRLAADLCDRGDMMASRSQSRRGLAHWMTSARLPVFVLDSRRVVLVFNTGCEQLTGWTASEVIGESCEFTFPTQDHSVSSITGSLAPPAEAYVSPVMAQERHLFHKSGAVQRCLVHFFPLQNDEEQSEPRVLGFITPGPLGASKPASPSFPSWHDALLRLARELRQRYQLSGIVTRNPMMERVLKQLQLVLPAAASVHFSGEAGSGKEYLARCLHSARDVTAGKPFVPLDCQGLTHFELFRTLQRAFDPDHQGEKPSGTLYLKHVTSLARDLQSFLLQAIRLEPDRWRLCSSSTESFDQACAEERCSPEFLYALTTCTIQVPALRDRLEDLPLLAQQMLEDRNRLLGTRLEGFETRVIQAFEKYQWPGNLRELAVVVNEAGEKSTGEIVTFDALPFRFRAGSDAQRTGPPVASVRQSLDDYLLQVERERIREVMELVQGNKTAAAELLGIPRPKLYRRLESLGLLDAQASITEPSSAADMDKADEPE